MVAPLNHFSFAPSSQTSIPLVAFVFLPAAEMMNGDVTVEPFPGEQMLTPGEVGAAHVPLPTVTCVVAVELTPWSSVTESRSG